MIANGLDNTLSYSWDLNTVGLTDTNLVRLKIIASNGESCDINGHTIKIIENSASNAIRSFSASNRKRYK